MKKTKKRLKYYKLNNLKKRKIKIKDKLDFEAIKKSLNEIDKKVNKEKLEFILDETNSKKINLDRTTLKEIEPIKELIQNEQISEKKYSFQDKNITQGQNYELKKEYFQSNPYLSEQIQKNAPNESSERFTTNLTFQQSLIQSPTTMENFSNQELAQSRKFNREYESNIEKKLKESRKRF